MDKLRVGILGVGSWRVNHVKARQGMPHADLVTAVDSAPGCVEKIAKTYDIPHWFKDYEALSEMKEVGSGSVVTPEFDQAKPVEVVAKAGKHVSVEKPIARAVSEVDRTIVAGRDAGVILMPDHLLRFATRHALIRDKLNRGELGSVFTIRLSRNRTKGNLQKHSRAHPLFVDLFRQSAYSRLAGWGDLKDATQLARDPTFRLMGSEKV